MRGNSSDAHWDGVAVFGEFGRMWPKRDHKWLAVRRYREAESRIQFDTGRLEPLPANDRSLAAGI